MKKEFWNTVLVPYWLPTPPPTDFCYLSISALQNLYAFLLWTVLFQCLHERTLQFFLVTRHPPQPRELCGCLCEVEWKEGFAFSSGHVDKGLENLPLPSIIFKNQGAEKKEVNANIVEFQARKEWEKKKRCGWHNMKLSRGRVHLN